MAGFFPPPPTFVGGHQPWAANASIVDSLAGAVTPPTQPPGPSHYPQIVAAFAWQPLPPPVQQRFLGALVGGVSSDQAPPTLPPGPSHYPQIIAAFAWQPLPPPVQQKPALQRITGPVITPPLPPAPLIPTRIGSFPHDEYDDDGWSFWKNSKRNDNAERLRQARIEIGLLPPDEEQTEAEVIKEALDARISVDEIAQRLSAHFYAKYQVGLRQAQAKADLERETQRRRQDYLLSSSERTQRTEQGKRLIMRQIIEDDDAKVMALLEDLL